MTARLAADLALGVATIVMGGLLVTAGEDVQGLFLDLLGVLFLYAGVQRFPAK
jgi:hypothetical protein